MGEELALKGRLTVRVVYGQKEATLPLLVVDGSGPSLLGHDWLATIKLDWHSLNKVQTEPAPPTNTLQDVLQRHGDVFKKELGTVRGVTPAWQPQEIWAGSLFLSPLQWRRLGSQEWEEE